MDYLLPTFKAVNLIFAVSAVITGAQAILNPVSFSKGFGLPLNAPSQDSTKPPQDQSRRIAENYASLMGVRQLGTGLTLLTFAIQGKWTEAATILAIIGVVVAGTDGFYLSQGPGGRGAGLFHAIPGAAIAALAAGVVYLKI